MLSIVASLVVGQTLSNQPVVLDGMLCHPRRLMVKLQKGESPKSLTLRGARVIQWIPEISWAVVELQRGDLRQLKSSLSRNPAISIVTYDRAAQVAYTPNDPRWNDMWHTRATKVDKAWDISRGSADVIVAVIDTGVNTAHEDLAANIWVNAGEVAGNSVDDDGNGRVDDINGWDFAYDDPIPNDVYGHGTPCAGLVAAIQDNSKGGCGVAPRARIMALKTAIDSGYLYDSANVPAYIYATNMGADVFSMSFYSDRVSAAEGDAIRYAAQNGVLPVAAAGNDYSATPYYPAGYEETLSVAAFGTNLLKTSWSNHGPSVDVSSPGTGLTATSAGGGYTAGFSGTSGACPQVAGLAALLKGANPSATAAQVRAAIEDTAIPVNEAPFGEYCNYGRIDAEAAMNAIMGAPAPSKSPVVRYISRLGAQLLEGAHMQGQPPIPTRIYGRGFQNTAGIAVTVGDVLATVVGSTRDYIDVLYETPTFGGVRVSVDGTPFFIPAPYGDFKSVYPLASASTPGGGASVFGGFSEALLADGTYLRTTRRSDSSFRLQGTFRKVTPVSNMRLALTHKFAGSPLGTVNVKLYDWSSASYPYGSFITLYSGAASLLESYMSWPVANPARFIDPEGTIIVQIDTSADFGSGSELLVDLLHLTEEY